MTKLSNYVVLSAVLSIISTSCLTPSVLAQDTEPSKTAAPEKAATPHKTQTAKRRTARKKAKLKADSTKVIEKGVKQAGTNLEK